MSVDSTVRTPQRTLRARPDQTLAEVGLTSERDTVLAAFSRPESTEPRRWIVAQAIGIVVVHLLALLALTPWFFSWTGVVLAVLGHYVFGMLGITIGYHRLLTHRGFECPKWLEHTLATLGVCCLQDSPARWVAIHRMHHKDSDEQPDPHTPRVGLWWSHLGWLMIENRDYLKITQVERFAPDMLRDPYYFWFERGLRWLWVYVAHALLFAAVGVAVGKWLYADWSSALVFAASVTLWGVFVRTVVVWHITWAVNSLTHVWGYRNYETSDNSRNNWLVALLAHGEGWHNNHHAQPRSVAHGHRWWEIDPSYLTICLFERVGLAKKVVRPR